MAGARVSRVSSMEKYTVDKVRCITKHKDGDEKLLVT